MNINLKLQEIFSNSLKKVGITEKSIQIDIPKNKDNGDYSTNLAMKFCKKTNMSPFELANKIIENIEDNKIISKVEVINPGFINIFINKNIILDTINEVIEKDKEYGKSNIGNNLKVNVEYVSANPTGILHLGTARGATYGDNLCNILEFAGFSVTREYYINDAGSQIINLGKSIKTRYLNLCGRDDIMPEDGYFGKEIVDIAKNIYEKHNDTYINIDLEYFMETGVSELLNKIKEDLEYLRVNFDVWTSEKYIRDSGKIEESLKILEQKNLIYELDGAKWLKTTNYGDDKDRVIVKKDLQYTYLVPDIAYHLDKIDRGYDMLINVLGADHHGYVSRLKASIEALGYENEKLHIKLLQMVRLIKDGEEVKMSKRTGKTVTIRELIDEVGVDAVRYFFAMRNLDTQMDFDITLATKKSNENPVYYVQYAHARICSILNTVKTIKSQEKYETINSEYAYNLLNKINEFKVVVESAATKQLPHLITNYLYELATVFHSFYSKEKIITNDEKYTNERLNLIKSVKITISNALNLIGVSAIEKM